MASPSPAKSAKIKYLEVDGPVDEEKTLIRYDVPYAPEDPKKTLKLRQRLGLDPEVRAVDANVRAVVDSFIPRRTWVEAGVQWVQHASPFPVARIDVVETHQKLNKMLAAQCGRATGICPIRTYLHGECFMELIRQVVTDSWERGLLLLKIHAERVAAQQAHRELFESRSGYAFRLALKGEKDTAAMIQNIGELKKKREELLAEEAKWKKKCEEFDSYADEQMKIDEKRHTDELNHLKRDAKKKGNDLEELVVQIPKK